jgi:L-fuculose-phosphate aldolase
VTATERTILEAICTSCRKLHGRNLLAAGDGNLSYRFRDDRIAMTPAGINKADLRPEQMCWLKLDGSVLFGQPTSERLMHLAIFRAVPEAKAIVHAHPPTAIAWSLAQPGMGFLPDEALPEVILAAGRIPVVAYARPGTADMGAVLLPFLPEHRLLLLARHGAVCWGESVQEAYNGIERLEHLCQILKSAAEMGGAKPLPAEEIAALRLLRAKAGPRVL